MAIQGGRAGWGHLQPSKQTARLHRSYAGPPQTEQGTRLTSTFAPYIQMEVVVPFEAAGDCLQGVSRFWGTTPVHKQCQHVQVGEPVLSGHALCALCALRQRGSTGPAPIPAPPRSWQHRSTGLYEGFRNPALIRFVRCGWASGEGGGHVGTRDQAPEQARTLAPTLPAGSPAASPPLLPLPPPAAEKSSTCPPTVAAPTSG